LVTPLATIGDEGAQLGFVRKLDLFVFGRDARDLARPEPVASIVPADGPDRDRVAQAVRLVRGRKLGQFILVQAKSKVASAKSSGKNSCL
jgi:hypothetical protein